MGLCGSANANAGEVKPEFNEVDRQLMEEQLKQLYNFKVLLLGAGESGKSTIVKQIALVHKKKLEEEEYDLVATSLHQNVVDCFKSLINACKNFELPLTEEDEKTVQMIMEQPENKRLTPEQGVLILNLWKSEGIQQTFARRNEFWLLDSFPYYVTHLERFCSPDFRPTEEDAIMARIRTTGIVVTEIDSKIDKEEEDEPDSLRFQVVDVGGQRNERKKWMHCFDDVSAILFVVNLAGYNQVMFEDQAKNRMEEELELFKKIATDRLFTDTPIFLFLNKLDLFSSMIADKPTGGIFQDYTGEAEVGPALTWVQEAFQKQCPKKQIFIEVVTASSDTDIARAFDNIKKGLYEKKRRPLLEKAREIRGATSPSGDKSRV